MLTMLILGVLALVSFPDRPTGPCADLDCSWQFALHYQAQHFWSGFPVTQFTYGPLGFLATPHDFGGWTAPVNIACRVLVQFGLGLELYLLARRQRGQVASVVIAGVLLFASPPAPEALELLVVIACLIAVTGRRALPRGALLGLGALAGVLTLVKFTVGLELIGAAAVVATAQRPTARWPRAVAGTVLAALVGLVAAFSIVTAQPSRFVAWVHGSLSVTGGYSAMATSSEGSHALTLEIVGEVVIAGLVVAWLLRANLRALLIAEGALYGFAKEGLTRFDSQHYMIAISTALLLAAAVFALRGRLHRAVWVVVVVLALLAILAPSYRARVGEASLGSTWHALTRTGGDQGALRAEYGIPPAVIATIGHSTVDIDPVDSAVVYAYGLHWAPIDTWARYTAYTSYLDHGDAASVSGSGRPTYLLVGPGLGGAIDNRWANAEAPAYQVAVVCYYTVVSRSSQVLLLRAGADKCGAPEPLGSSALRPGVAVHVPTLPGPGLVVAYVQVPADPAASLVAAVLKPRGQTDVRINGVQRRLVVATADDGIVVRSPAAFASDLPTANTVAAVKTPLSVRWVYLPFAGAGR